MDFGVIFGIFYIFAVLHVVLGDEDSHSVCMWCF